jgi:hypothetical protein
MSFDKGSVEDLHLLAENYTIHAPDKRFQKMKDMIPSGIFVILFILFFLSIGGVFALLWAIRNPELSLPKVVHVDAIEKHILNFDRISKLQKTPQRSVSHGFNESANYVSSVLSQETKGNIWRQHFNVPVYDQIGKPTLSQIKPTFIKYKHETDFVQMNYGGKGKHNISAPLFIVDFGPGTGCNMTHFKSFDDGFILMSSETKICSLYDKALNAQKFGIRGILFEQLSESKTQLTKELIRYPEWTYNFEVIEIPVFSVSFLVGKTLRNDNFIDKSM